LAALLVLGMVAVGAGRAEHGDRAGQLGEHAEALDELAWMRSTRHGSGVHPIGRAARVEQALVGGSLILTALARSTTGRAAARTGVPRRAGPARADWEGRTRPRRYCAAVCMRSVRADPSGGMALRLPQEAAQQLGAPGDLLGATCSSRVCARFGSPGPKLIAGMPSAANRDTSVQPYLATGRAPVAARNRWAAGAANPGNAPAAVSGDPHDKPGEHLFDVLGGRGTVRSGRTGS